MAVQLALEVLPVLLRRADAQVELAGDLLVAEADREQLEHLALAGRERGQPARRALLRRALPRAVDESARHLGREVRAVLHDRLHRERELLGLGVLILVSGQDLVGVCRVLIE